MAFGDQSGLFAGVFQRVVLATMTPCGIVGLLCRTILLRGCAVLKLAASDLAKRGSVAIAGVGLLAAQRSHAVSDSLTELAIGHRDGDVVPLIDCRRGDLTARRRAKPFTFGGCSNSSPSCLAWLIAAISRRGSGDSSSSRSVLTTNSTGLLMIESFALGP